MSMKLLLYSPYSYIHTSVLTSPDTLLTHTDHGTCYARTALYGTRVLAFYVFENIHTYGGAAGFAVLALPCVYQATDCIRLSETVYYVVYRYPCDVQSYSSRNHNDPNKISYT